MVVIMNLLANITYHRVVFWLTCVIPVVRPLLLYYDYGMFLLPDQYTGLTAGVIIQQGMLTPPRHKTPPLVFSGVRVPYPVYSSSEDSSDVKVAVINRERAGDDKYRRAIRKQQQRDEDAENKKERNMARQEWIQHQKMLEAGRLNREKQKQEKIRKQNEKEARENDLRKGIVDISRPTGTGDIETSVKHQDNIVTPVRGQQKVVNNRDDQKITKSRDISSKHGTQSAGKVPVHSARPRQKTKELNLHESEIIPHEVQKGQGHDGVPKKKEKNKSHDTRENGPTMVHQKTAHSLASSQPDTLEHQKTPSPQENHSQESSSGEHEKTTHSPIPSQPDSKQ